MRNLIAALLTLFALLAGGNTAFAQAQTCNLPANLAAVAASVGYTRNTFCETWANGTNTIDMNDTTQPGFNWYVHGVFPNAPTQYVDSEIKSGAPVRTPRSQYIVVNNGTMSLSNISPNAADRWGNWLNTCAWNGSEIVGNFFGNGLFVDVVMSADASLGSAQEPCPTCPFTSDTYPGNWPTFWGDPIEFSGGTGAPGDHYVDFSVVEISPIACTIDNNTCQMLQGIHDLYPPFVYPLSAPAPYQMSSVFGDPGDNYIPSTFPGFDYRQPHHYSMLWQPAVQNNGLGQYTFYTDGVQMFQLTYSAGGTIPTGTDLNGNPQTYPGQYIFGDVQHQCFYVSDSLIAGHPNTLGTVQVWQLPIVSLTAPSIATSYAGFAVALPGVTVADSASPAPSTISVNLKDATGLLSATGQGVTGSGTNNLTINSSVANVNAALATVAFTGTATDTIVITATDNLGNVASEALVTVTVLPVCSQATSFLARTVGLSTTYQGAYVNMICGLVTDGDWQNLDAFYMYVTNSTATLALNLVQNNYNLTLNGSCVFVPSGGYQGDGATCDQDTGFNPATAAGANYALNLAFMGVCVLNQRTTPNASVWEMGADDGTNISGLTLLNSAGTAQWYVNASSLSEITSGVAFTQGSWAIDRFASGTTDTNLWYDGVFATTPGSASSSAVPNTDIIIMALAAAPGSDQSPDNFGYAWIGGLVNPTHIYNRAHTFIQAVGGRSGC